MKFFVLTLLVIGIALSCNADSSEDGRRDKKGKKSASCQCGWRRHPQSRIVGGEESGVNEWPMMVGLIEYSDNWRQQICGGTILTKRHIVTAAHCFFKELPNNKGTFVRRDAKSLGIVVGAHNWNTADDANYLQVQEYTIHENYHQASLRNDVALIAVKNIPFSDIVGPACFPKSRLSVIGDDVYTIGWGYTSWDGDTQMTTTDVLKKAKLVAMGLEKCSTKLNAFDLQNPHQLCTYNPGTSVCPGDSGGPLLWLDPELNRYTLVGITSFVPEEGCTGLSGFVDTSAFINWIKPKVEYIGESLCTKV